PSFSAAWTELMATGSPSTRIWPTSGVCTPARIFISVLLPAPFSPLTASTSPRPSVRLTPVSALTPGKRLLTSRTSRRGGAAMGTRQEDTGRASLPGSRGHAARAELRLGGGLALPSGGWGGV